VPSDKVKVGATVGLSRPRPRFSPQGVVYDGPTVHDPEQVYVHIDTAAEPWTDADERPHAARSVQIEGWNGYATVTRLHLTRRRAADLAGLLLQALVSDEEGST
jgi:hypothetical protein